MAVATLWLGPAAGSAEKPTVSPAAFQTFVAGLRPEALQRGIPADLFDRTFDGMTPDPSVAAQTAKQPEFQKPIGAYLKAQITAPRVAQGRAMLGRWAGPLGEIERRTGVPSSIVVTVWGLESNYGASVGTKDVVRSLSTLAAIHYRPDLYRAEVLAALDMLKGDAVPREKLRGSWAGAMGQPQFLPSSFEKYAVDGDGDGRRDIWTDAPDALASIANFIHAQGWQTGRPWGFEVRLPPGLDPGASRADAAEWAARGVRRTDGAALPANGELILFFPAGASGPAFLVTSNFEVIKTYNFSDAYVLSVGDLAARIEGGPGLAGSWPTDPPMSKADRIALQSRLVVLGYEIDNREGRVSLALRDVVRKAQSRVGQVPDGNPTKGLLDALGKVGP